MAVMKASETKALKFKVRSGVNSSGNPTFATRTLGAVKINAANEDLFACGKSLADLQGYPIEQIAVSESYALIGE